MAGAGIVHGLVGLFEARGTIRGMVTWFVSDGVGWVCGREGDMKDGLVITPTEGIEKMA